MSDDAPPLRSSPDRPGTVGDPGAGAPLDSNGVPASDDPDPARRRALPGAVVGAGVALAVLVARDGAPGWSALRVLVVAASTAGGVAWLRRPGTRSKGVLLVGAGAVVVAVSAGFLPHLVKNGLSVTAVAAVGVVCGIAMVVGGKAMAQRDAKIGWRILGGLGAVVTVLLVMRFVSPAVLATNVPDVAIGDTPAAVGLDHESVSFTTDDGVRLAAWYIPSENGAAVVLRHGAGSTRSSVLRQAAVLSRHGFGVLLVDARGHGESEGRAMDFGWFGDADIAAATTWLATRDDVDPDRIGVVGMSMGGEEAIGAAAADPRIRAVVAEGATARSAADKAWLSTTYGAQGAFQEQLDRLQFGLTDLLTSAGSPTPLRSSVETSGDTAFLLIAAGEVTDEIDASAHIAAGAPDRVEVWIVPDAGHTAGLATDPDEWERRVVDFLETNLD